MEFISIKPIINKNITKLNYKLGKLRLYINEILIL